MDTQGPIQTLTTPNVSAQKHVPIIRKTVGQQKEYGLTKLDTVRALHETVVALRSALEKSKNEIKDLKKIKPNKIKENKQKNGLESTVEKLSIENHILREKIISDKLIKMDKKDEVVENGPSNVNENKDEDDSKVEINDDNNGDVEEEEEDDEEEEVDDIELIFTTDDTKELPTLQETLESITEDESSATWDKNGVVLLKYRPVVNEFDTVVEEDDQITEDEQQQEECNKLRRNTCPITGSSREYKPIAHREVINRNNEIVRPILMERGVTNKRESTSAQTDITALPLQWKSESYLARHKAVAQNFTTLPSKFAIPSGNTTSSTNKPTPQIIGLRLSEKTREARRTLLSDLGFTSMVPELSRSVDHLCRSTGETVIAARNFPRALSYMKQIDSMDSSLASPAIARNGRWLCECLAHTGSSYYPSIWDSSTGSSIAHRLPWSPVTPQTPCDKDGQKRRYVWRSAGTTHSAEAYRGATLVRECAISAPWGSVPTSPTHQDGMYSGHWALENDGKISSSSTRSGGLFGPRSKSRVTFQDCASLPWHARRSLPDLSRCDGGHHSHRPFLDSGGSTESLIDEAEEFLRHSIDSMVTGTDWTKAGHRRQTRRFSEPDPVRDFQPPFTARPFLPRQPRDLREECLVKIIAPDGRVLVGRVRFVGTLTAAGVNEPVVGVELPDSSQGNSDGTLHGYRLFDCEPGKAVFVPFKKVILAWSI